MRSATYFTLSLSYGLAGRKNVSHPVACTLWYGVETRVNAPCGNCSDGYVCELNVIGRHGSS
jgi:hypothetical protein